MCPRLRRNSIVLATLSPSSVSEDSEKKTSGTTPSDHRSLRMSAIMMLMARSRTIGFHSLSGFFRSSSPGRPVVLKAALMDVLATSGFLRVPIILEYEELKKLELNAVTDPLTGLYNRRLFGESFEKELNRARRYTQPLSLVILDLHRFKEVNDKHGHPRGDEVLRATAATLKKALRTSDSAFRIGGDEFALLLPQTDAQQALALSRRVESVFAEMLQPLQLEVAVSMDHGIAIFPQDAEQSDQLIRIADERLYRQKHANHKKTLDGADRIETVPSADQAPGPAVSLESPGPLPPPISIETMRADRKGVV